jgi:lipoprotein-releasing system permease protein
MFKILLISKLLRRKLAPSFAILAVTLCTAMVIIVNSVMGGFLTSMREAGKALSGDVWVNAGMDGFPHYRELIESLEKDPAIAAATPVLKATGLMQFGRGAPRLVEVEGIEPEGMDRVTGIKERFFWKSEHFIQAYERALNNPDYSEDMRKEIRTRMEVMKGKELRDRTMEFKGPESWGNMPGIVPGIAMYSQRDAKGNYQLGQSLTGRADYEEPKMTVTVLPITQSGAIRTPELRQFMVVNEVKSGLYELDAKKAYLPLPVLQQMMKMDSVPQVDRTTGEPTGKMTEARVTNVVVKGKAGFTLEQIEAATQRVVEAFQKRHGESMQVQLLNVITWEQLFSRLLGAVENEKGMLTFLFAIISLVALLMVGVIFYMIVLEKTRDIGVLRALGASGFGILGVFVGFGVTIGVVGAALGFGLAALVVNNLNGIQYFLANYLGVTGFLAIGVIGGTLVGGIVGVAVGLWRGRVEKPLLWCTAGGFAAGTAGCVVYLFVANGFAAWLNTKYRFMMWDPRVYYFDRIPARLEMNEVYVILVVAVVASVIGSLVPAVLAARVNPVESLRYE